MKTPARLDLNRLPVDERGFLARALELGVRLGRFREPFLDALGAYLQLTAMEHARRFRTGIRIGAEQVSLGVQRVAVCMDEGLNDAAGGDLNAALELLQPDGFEALRRRGWERVHGRLGEMRESAIRILKSPYRGLLKGEGPRLRRWATIRPDDATAEGPEGDREEMNLVSEFSHFRRVERQARFLGTLPKGLLRDLPEAQRRSWGFDRVMQGVVAALASDAETLVPDGPGQARLKALCDPSGILNPDARRKAEGMLREHLRTRGLDEESISGLMAAAQEALNQRIPEEGRKARKAVDEKWEK